MKTLSKQIIRQISFWRLLLVLPIILLSGCVQTIFSVQFPEKGGNYVGNEVVDFVVNYNKTVSHADIFLNGTPIGDEFTYGPSSAKASIIKIKKYLKQGVNTLTVDPLAFGPTVQFVVDNAGPDIVITYGKTHSLVTADIGGLLRDASGVSSLKVNVVLVTGINSETGEVTRSTGPDVNIPVDANGNFLKNGIDISSGVTLYTFTATDIHGQISKKEILADSNEIAAMSISNAVRVAVGDSFIESLRPIIASQLYTSLQKAPIDIQWKCWNDPLKDDPVSSNPDGGFCASGSRGQTPISANTTQDGATFNSGLNPVYATILGIDFTIWVKRINMQPNLSTVLLNKFQIQANNYLKIDMIITELLVSLKISGKILFIPLNIDPMTMTIGRTVVDTGAVVSAVNKKFHVELTDSNFSLDNISVSQTSIGGIDLGGLVDLIMPLLEGVIADLLPGILNPILNDNLQKIVIGSCVYPKDNVTNTACNDANSSAMFNWAANVETLKTDNLFGAGSPYDMIIGIETRFNLLKADPNTRPSLGAVYVEDPVDVSQIYNSKGDAGTNLTVAVSSNALNQAFSALYQSGLTHITIVDGAITYGADPTKPAGTEGKTRVRLYPESPPYFSLNPVAGGVGGAAAASVGYESAFMYLDKYEGGVWKTQLKLGVDFNIAAGIAQEGNAVRLSVHGSPVFNLRSMVNNTGLPVTQSMLQGVLDLVTMYFLPQLADRFIIIDLSQLANTSLNGTKVLYQTDQDAFAQTVNYDGDGKCTSVTNNSSGADNKYDYVCETINFVVNTNTVTSTGSKGTNLLFQMEARDPDIPAAPAIPRFDLDGDGVLDYKDNCSVPILMQVAAINLEGGLIPANVDINGNPVGTFVDRVKAHINRWVAAEHGAVGFTKGSYLAPISAGSGTPPTPIAGDIAWWNVMRKGDNPVTSLGTYPWINMIYSNHNQLNTDGDRVGELCEGDDDRDAIYVDNGIPRDTCPTVYDPSNDAGACTIDQAQFVMFKNQQNGKCMSHANFAGVDETSGVKDFSPGMSNAGRQLQFAVCNVNDIAQRFYIEVSPTDSDPTAFSLPTPRPIPTTCVSADGNCKERIIYIYSNEDKQTEPGFYNTVNMHYLATTIANAPPAVAGSCSAANGYWGYDDVIVTTMCGYNNSWREWVLSLSGDTSYPFMIESYRSWRAYSKRGCLFEKATGSNVDFDTSTETPPDGSCYPNDAVQRKKASWQVLLGASQVPWSGRFSDD